MAIARHDIDFQRVSCCSVNCCDRRMFAGFVDIGRIVHRQCLNFLFIIEKNKNSETKKVIIRYISTFLIQAPPWRGIELMILIAVSDVICHSFVNETQHSLNRELTYQLCCVNLFYTNITLTNRIYLFNSAEYLTASITVVCKHVQNFRPPRSFDFQLRLKINLRKQEKSFQRSD